MLGLGLACLLACAEEQPTWLDDPLAEPQAMSLLGEPLYALPDSAGEVAGADLALASAPDDVELLLAAARVRWNYWHYRQAIRMYTRVMELAPDDWRPHTYRGIRQFSLREFDGAIADLERARELAPSNYDVSYYLGVVYFVTGRFDDAATELVRCMDQADDPAADTSASSDFRSCSQYATDPGQRVSLSDWTVRALLQSGRVEEAAAILDTIADDLTVSGLNLAYYRNLLFYKGLRTVDEIMNLDDPPAYRLETVGYGVASWYLAQGDTALAVEVLEQIVTNPWWPGYGRIGAEAELVRLNSLQ